MTQALRRKIRNDEEYITLLEQENDALKEQVAAENHALGVQLEITRCLEEEIHLLLAIRDAAIDVIVYHGTPISSKMLALNIAVDAYDLTQSE
jgi:hypothetical protein